MGVIANQFLKRLRKGRAAKVIDLASIRAAETVAGDARSRLEAISASDRAPVYRLYTVLQNMLSLFTEEAAAYPELDEFREMHRQAEDEYIPSGPPMSPLTLSYYTYWAFADFRFGAGETMVSCFIAAAPVLGIPAYLVEAAGVYARSRMGLYVQVARDGDTIRLRELLTDRVYDCINYSGYAGKRSEIWFTRLVAAPDAESGPYVLLTMPYICTRSSEKKWEAFFARHGLRRGNPQLASELHEFMKYGPERFYWHEFIFCGYSGSDATHIRLRGIPDLKATLPHA